MLRTTANPNYDFRGRNGFDVPRQHGSIAHLDRVVGRSPQFIAHATARSIVRVNLQRKVTAIETFLAEFKNMFSRTELDRLGSHPGFNAIYLDQGSFVEPN